ncbi:MbtH family NRPS accessory protein [Paucibacter sp. APW11]|uniref:MbtH family NRPS accessory protein n=1 Tax=Roseateles aquae TaxID=3077235 RepID=A0ABU3P945_9BURK|nr:MbtH family NRPS accessory protein [Paucibacter sp. APW11]MDT8999094.1 MbtH family NRPS accessory protein [Paucibacter sp. APW11]
MQAAADDHFLVVLNEELQYSIWPYGRDIPLGWRAEGFQGPRADCLSHIERVWVDMRPLSVRQHVTATR